MPAMLWLELDDQFLLDGEDYRVIALLIGRTDRLSFRLLTVEPMLGGDPRELLQLDDAMLEAEAIPADALGEDVGYLGGRLLRTKWSDEVGTERAARDGRRRFGRGECSWYTDDDGAVAVLIEEPDSRHAVLGAPLAPSRINLSYTVGLRRGGRG